jgi:hypothetical protein
MWMIFRTGAWLMVGHIIMCPRALLNDPSKCEVAREEWDAGPTKHTPEDFASSVRERGPN